MSACCTCSIINGRRCSTTGGGSAVACDSNPQPLGVAAPGVSAEYSRCDHVHPAQVVATPSLAQVMIVGNVSGASLVMADGHEIEGQDGAANRPPLRIIGGDCTDTGVGQGVGLFGGNGGPNGGAGANVTLSPGSSLFAGETPGAVQLAGRTVLSSPLTDAVALAAVVNDYAPAGLNESNVLRVTPAAGGTLCTGILRLAAVGFVTDFAILTVMNLSATDPLIFPAEHAGSVATARFAQDIIVPPLGSQVIIYDATSGAERWRALASTPAPLSATFESALNAAVVGSVQTTILRFNGLPTIVGVGLAAVNSATNGTSVTISQPGVYAIACWLNGDESVLRSVVAAISDNGTTGGTAIPSYAIVGMHGILRVNSSKGTGGSAACTYTRRVTAAEAAAGVVISFRASDGLAAGLPTGLLTSPAAYKIERIAA